MISIMETIGESACIHRLSSSHVTLNVNVPAIKEGKIRDNVVVKQERVHLMVSFDRRMDRRKKIYSWLTARPSPPFTRMRNRTAVPSNGR